MEWNNLSIPKLQRFHRWSLGMDKYFHPTLCNGCNYLPMRGFKLIQVSKRGPWYRDITLTYIFSLNKSTIICTCIWKHAPQWNSITIHYGNIVNIQTRASYSEVFASDLVIISNNILKNPHELYEHITILHVLDRNIHHILNGQAFQSGLLTLEQILHSLDT